MSSIQSNRPNISPEGYREEERPDNSFLFVLEEKLHIPEKVIKHIPSFITNRTLMHTGFIAALLSGLSFFLTTFNKTWFLVGAFLLLVFLFCDRYDGRVARAKGVISKRGYFADHMFDTLSLFAIFLGLGLSPAMKISIALAIVIFYYILAINAFLMTYVRGKFIVTFFRFSPAEAILILVIFCIINFALPYPTIVIHNLFGIQLTFLDLVGCVALLAFAYLAISTTYKNFIIVEQFEKRYPADTIWMYLRKRQFVKNEYVDQIIDDLEKLFDNKTQ
jgi:phosphatidylglycerophosphate synthase